MKKNTITILIYLSGMLSLFLVDFIVVRYESTETIANWASIKSVVMIGGTISLLGMDQVMVRVPQQALGILKRSYFQLVITVSIYCLVIFTIGLLKEGLSLAIAVFAVALSTLHFGYLRAHFLLILAQIVTNGWKILFLIFLSISIFFELKLNFSIIYIASISIILSLVFIFHKNTSESNTNDSSENILEQFGLGARFFISLLTLNLSLYLEQVLLNAGGHTKESSIYFSHFAVILPLFMLFNGYIGFVLGPYIRRNTEKFDSLLIRFWWVSPLFALSLGIFSYFISKTIFIYFLGDKSTFLPYLAIIVTSIGILRIIYILPSSYLGVIAPKKYLDKFIIINSLSIMVLISSFYLIYRYTNDALFAIAYASLMNWLIRSVYGNYLVWSVWKTRNLGFKNGK